MIVVILLSGRINLTGLIYKESDTLRLQKVVIGGISDVSRYNGVWFSEKKMTELLTGPRKLKRSSASVSVAHSAVILLN